MGKIMETETDRMDIDFRPINLIVCVMMFFASIWWLLTLGLMLFLFIPFIILNVLLASFYKKYKSSGSHRAEVISLRCVIIAIIAVLSVSPFIIRNFENNRSMYTIKRLVYTYGSSLRGQDLPSKIPAEVEDYDFYTPIAIHGPDSAPHSCLSFVCDKETAEDYLNDYVDKVGAKKHEHSSKRFSKITFKEYLGGYDERAPEDKHSLLNSASLYLDVPSFPDYRIWVSMQTEQLVQCIESVEVYENNAGRVCMMYDPMNSFFVFWG